ncbi:MAG: threonylcarbamoyl-AMP synthase [Spirochaetaceae bacterium]|jgi:L-threonylcarbamoyladenylate synthase|nr:threonylcarbamoyl-AMP synthase [Spirochaetaceae bacterium]
MVIELNEKNIFTAGELVRAGKIVAFPTETVYGLGCDAFNSHALARVFEVKKRPRFDPLIIHIASLDTLERLVDFSRLSMAAEQRLSVLGRALWPGPLTLVMPKLKAVPDLATGGLDTVAIRFPAHDGALRLIKESTGAVAAPSANPFGYLSPTRAEHVLEQLGDAVDLVLDGGPTDIGMESTVLDICGDVPRILRPGGTPQNMIETLTGPLAAESPGGGGKISSPGQLTSHYAPSKDLYLHTEAEMRRLAFPEDNAAYMFFNQASFEAFAVNNNIPLGHTDRYKRFFILSPSGSLAEAAARLFDTLHTMDALSAGPIHAERPPDTGLGEAINDRLSRAAAARTHRRLAQNRDLPGGGSSGSGWLLE